MGGLDPPIQIIRAHRVILDGRLKAGHGEELR
jgi:hypothetical protein